MLDRGDEWGAIDSYQAFKELAADPRTPETNYLRLYAKDNGSGVSALFYIDDAGNVKNLSGGITGTGTANRLAYWTAATVLAANAALTQNRLLTADANGLPTSVGALTSTRIPFADSNGLPTDDDELSWDNTNKKLFSGNPSTHTGTNGRLTLDLDGQVTLMELAGHHTVGPAFQWFFSRGTHAAPTVVLADDRALFILANSYGGSSYHNLAAIQMLVDGTPGNNDMPGRIAFFTTPDGSATLAERFRIGSAGQWGIGGATFGTANNLFKSGGASAAPAWGTVNILDSDSHGDTLTGTVVRGDIIRGNSTPKWSRLAVGTVGQYLGSDGTDALWRAQSTLDHGSIGGLTDDDHTGYALLAGRSGGQTLIGGTAAADDLILRATAGVGAGSEAIILQVGSNGALEGLRVGQANSQSVVSIGTSVLAITNASTLNPRLILSGAGVAHNFQIIRHTTPGGGGATQTLSATRGAGANTHTAVQAGDALGQLEFSGSDGTRFITGALVRAMVATTFTTDTPVADLGLYSNPGTSATTPVESLRLSSAGNCVVGRGASSMFLAALATDATDGFLYIPTCAGTPTGTPTAYTGKVAMVYDTTNNELYIYDGAWVSVPLT